MQKLNADGDFVEAPYEAELMSFIHEDFQIRNPFLSECGRFSVDPQLAYGFQPVHTGGGCMALIKDLGDGKQIWLTDDSGCNLPDLEDSKNSILGVFKNGEQVAFITLSDIPFEGDEPTVKAKPGKAARRHDPFEPGL